MHTHELTFNLSNCALMSEGLGSFADLTSTSHSFYNESDSEKSQLSTRYMYIVRLPAVSAEHLRFDSEKQLVGYAANGT